MEKELTKDEAVAALGEIVLAFEDWANEVETVLRSVAAPGYVDSLHCKKYQRLQAALKKLTED